MKMRDAKWIIFLLCIKNVAVILGLIWLADRLGKWWIILFGVLFLQNVKISRDEKRADDDKR